MVGEAQDADALLQLFLELAFHLVRDYFLAVIVHLAFLGLAISGLLSTVCFRVRQEMLKQGSLNNDNSVLRVVEGEVVHAHLAEDGAHVQMRVGLKVGVLEASLLLQGHLEILQRSARLPDPVVARGDVVIGDCEAAVVTLRQHLGSSQPGKRLLGLVDSDKLDGVEVGQIANGETSLCHLITHYLTVDTYAAVAWAINLLHHLQHFLV